MGSILKRIIVVLAISAPVLGASAGQAAAFCSGAASTESLRDRMTCVSQLVASQTEEILRRMGVASRRTTSTSPLAFTNREFDTLFDIQRMREGIPAPQIRIENFGEPSVCGDRLVRDLPIYYCPEDGNVVINVSSDFLDVENPYGQSVAAGRLSAACMVAHEIGHHLIEDMRIEQVFFDLGSEPELVQDVIFRGELFADFFAGAFMSLARDLPVFQQELGAFTNLNACNEMIRLTGSDAPGISPGDRNHSTSRQRQFWFNRGVVSSGNLRLGDVFYPNFQDIQNGR